MDNYNYPEGADTPDAPWNQVDPPEREIEVTVSMTISKTFTINVNDYEEEVEEDEDGLRSSIDYSNCNLFKAVEEQVTLPTDLPLFTKRIFNADLDLKAAKMPLCLKQAIEDCEGWDIDEMEVIHD
jgi:hypothetical protein